jgi:hypothetical protein
MVGVSLRVENIFMGPNKTSSMRGGPPLEALLEGLLETPLETG